MDYLIANIISNFHLPSGRKEKNRCGQITTHAQIHFYTAVLRNQGRHFFA